MRFEIEADPTGSPLRRFAAYYDFHRTRTVCVADEEFCFQAGESFRLFFSYRHTSDSLRDQLRTVGLAIEQSWVTASGEEGVFLCRPAAPAK
jgi:hypothetical protein